MSFSRGVADGMLEGRAAAAEGAASFAQYEALDANRRASKAQANSQQVTQIALEWKQHAAALKQVLDERTATASAALVVLNSLIDVIKQLPPSQQQVFKMKLAETARNRMREIDAEPQNKQNPSYKSLQSSFAKVPSNSELRIV